MSDLSRRPVKSTRSLEKRTWHTNSMWSIKLTRDDRHIDLSMRVLGLLLLLTLQSAATATNSAAIDCVTNQDCSDGETCVAGDSATPVQSCVAGAVCGGSTSGNCPGNAVSGQLACLLHQGIYKCLSIDRCDEYFGGSTCSGETATRE